MTIEVIIAPKSDVHTVISELLSQVFSIEISNAHSLYDKRIKPLVDKLKDSIYILAETQYVDKVYRDSYYSYYSSKLLNYSRNCIRISLFDGEINDDDFRNSSKIETLRKTLPDLYSQIYLIFIRILLFRHDIFNCLRSATEPFAYPLIPMEKVLSAFAIV